MVVAIQDYMESVLQNQDWFAEAIRKAAALNSQYLAINPPVKEPEIQARWYLCAGLPLAYKHQHNPKILLCDLGLPTSIFRKAGIQYESPFSSKFVIQLEPK